MLQMQLDSYFVFHILSCCFCIVIFQRQLLTVIV